MSESIDLPEALRLSATEARLLGCLIEKEATTPEQYPLTENALVVASNQKTSRDPVMELTLGEVGHALRQLEPRHLVRSVHGARAQRYEHLVSRAYGLTAQQQALLGLLLLRGPQTLNELLTRSERMARFADADDLRHALERMAERQPSLVLRVPRAAGQREERWMHLLCGPVDLAAFASAAAEPRAARSESGSALEARLAALEARVEALESALGLARDGASPE
ncbi:MAG: DUF480 domain-containing protein [Chiayiivirga sp.]|jgi:uncharacterized protein YceH (UPF0502 family)|uniref:YceH family protein n=1 Tax=Chiayiivirga sp. TaxID=2041042 RepID=UPI0025C3AD04|nr:DUF480 domain-containing protein [Chiayiivirga sp.]MCI1729394.1 DUF480 domain-containing protein [Chiayiivirga sp.]